jgi:hypothetical protein
LISATPAIFWIESGSPKSATPAATVRAMPVSGADPVDSRPGFSALLAYCEAHSVGVVLVENASRFARDLAVQLTSTSCRRSCSVPNSPTGSNSPLPIFSPKPPPEPWPPSPRFGHSSW